MERSTELHRARSRSSEVSLSRTWHGSSGFDSNPTWVIRTSGGSFREALYRSICRSSCCLVGTRDSANPRAISIDDRSSEPQTSTDRVTGTSIAKPCRSKMPPFPIPFQDGSRVAPCFALWAANWRSAVCQSGASPPRCGVQKGPARLRRIARPYLPPRIAKPAGAGRACPLVWRRQVGCAMESWKREPGEPLCSPGEVSIQ